jgi:hypothetical protein
MIEQIESRRPKPSRRAVAVVVAADLAIASAVGFAVYFGNRKFGPPTPPRDVAAATELCLPEECRRITPTVTLTWSPPQAGGAPTGYVVTRGDEELERLGAGTRSFTDTEVTIGERYSYEVSAVGAEGRGHPSGAVEVRVPVPPIEHAHFGGAYDVTLTFRRIGLLSRFEGVNDPAVGDRAFAEWDLLSVCAPLEGACDVALFGYELTRHGREYRGTLPSEARCGDEALRSRQTVTIRVDRAQVMGSALIATKISGVSEVDFRCNGEKVHAVAAIAGTVA